MAIADFLQQYNARVSQNAPTGLTVKPAPTTIKQPTLAIKPPSNNPQTSTQPTYGSTLQAVLDNTKLNAQNLYDSNRASQNSDLVNKITSMSAGTIPVDQYGIVQRPQTNYQATAKSNVNTIGQIGTQALQGVEAKAQWQQLNKLQNMSSQISSFIPAGATADNPGAQAVAKAMAAYTNGVGYVWGGNSLQTGVDCSGLVQQAYKAIGINLPRTTYEQAKSGQVIKGVQNALPGDLIFYSTGKNDPNGIGVNSHVALYLGNGMILEAANSKAGIRKVPIGYDGAYSAIVRPWS